MPFSRSFNVVGIHTAGEVCDVIVGGVLDVPGKSMFEKMMHFWKKEDGLRQLLLNEPRGCAAMCQNLILPPCNPEADAGFIIMEHEEYPPMSGANTIATATVLLETGMVPMKEPTTKLKLDTPAGLVTVVADCDNGKCKSISFHNVPAFVFVLDQEISVPGLGPVKVDIAWGGMIYVLVDATSIGLAIKNTNGAKIVEIGEKIKRAVQEQTSPVHPENPEIRGVSVLEFTEPLKEEERGKVAVNTVVVSPGRLDRSPCGTGTCARLAVLHARGQLSEGEPLYHQSIIGTEFIGKVHGTTKVGDYPAVFPAVTGSAWITSYKQVVLDKTDPFPEGFRVGDSWVLEEK
jgi:proline racemase